MVETLDSGQNTTKAVQAKRNVELRRQLKNNLDENKIILSHEGINSKEFKSLVKLLRERGKNISSSATTVFTDDGDSWINVGKACPTLDLVDLQSNQLGKVRSSKLVSGIVAFYL